MKILFKELISSYFVICYHKLAALQAHQHGISRVFLAYWGYLRSRKVKYSGFHAKFEDQYRSIPFQPLTQTSSSEKSGKMDLSSTLGLYSLFLLIVYPLPISSFSLLITDKLVNNWRSTEQSSCLWTFKMHEIIKANICHSAHVQGTLINSQEWSLNPAFARNTSLGLNSIAQLTWEDTATPHQTCFGFADFYI